jgi:VanZ family protein
MRISSRWGYNPAVKSSWWSRYLPILAWMGVIYFLSAQSSLPSPDDPLLNLILKKLGHMTVYAILMLLSLRAVAIRSVPLLRVVICYLFITAYGLSDEYHQSFVAGRSPALTDVLFDMAGGAVAILLWQRLYLAQGIQEQY